MTVGDDARVVAHDELEGAAWLALCTVQVALDACGEHLLGVEHLVAHLVDGRVDDVIDRVHLCCTVVIQHGSWMYSSRTSSFDCLVNNIKKLTTTKPLFKVVVYF